MQISKLKSLQSLLSSDAFFYVTMTVLLFIIAVFPIFRKMSLTPKNYVYTFAQTKTSDFYFYQAVMRQGKRGAWLVSHPFVSEYHRPSLLFFYYIVLGKLSALLRINTVMMYFLAIFIQLFVLIFLVIRVLKLFLSRQLQKIGFILVFFAGPFPHLVDTVGKTLSFSIGWPWTLQWESPYHRLVHVPHHTFAEILLMITVLFLIRFFKDKRLLWVSIAGVIQAISIVVFPAPTVVLYMAFLLVLYFLLLIGYRSAQSRLWLILASAVFFLISGVFLVLLRTY